VIQVKKALEGAEGEVVTILVDNEAALENVSRFARNKGYSVDVEEKGEASWSLTIREGDVSLHASRFTLHDAVSPPVVFIASEAIGSGDDKLGRILMEGFVNTLAEQDHAPDKLLLMNGGVRLATEGSPVLATLKALTDRGCEILVCGTCLDFFDLKEKLAAGVVSNMYDIQAAMLAASKIIRP
jgi:selenium metabolism protein YedF